ncbi:uracil phosphoribosyltransferase homolog isoform X1 [Monodelphis domestica]|uniref:Uracil phosphoribosyltransferase homolog n=2 Tax=Monodelphis domestica TaxID=13616 RepID=K7DYX0_MONDO|nr:uracil phosphoribosyltransferase homolog isoform X1 [Monodelphis domestica]
MAKELGCLDAMPCHNQQLVPPAAAAAANGGTAAATAAAAPQCPEPTDPNGQPEEDLAGGPAKLPAANGPVAGPAGDSSEGPQPEDCESGDLITSQLGPQLKLLPINDQIRELQTIIRDKTASRGDFMFSADRLIRLIVEEGLNQLPYKECTVTTPTGYKYEGVKFEKGNCGVSIMRSGEAMEQGLRDCCRSIRIGKILIQSDEETQRAKVYYAKFPPDIYRRKVLLMYPILSTGNTVIEAIKVLVEHGVQPSVIIVLSLFSTPHGATSIIREFPEITILTTEVHPVAPTHFGQKYFGTD